MTKGHCRHCAKDCEARIGIGNFVHNNFRRGASWIDGHCPACAEAERIATAIDDMRLPPPEGPLTDLDHGWRDGYFDALKDASEIARGES